MSVISASSAGVKDMADGSLRITFEFEPRHAADAFALFGPRGRAVAIAALKDGHGEVVDEQPVAGSPVTPDVRIPTSVIPSNPGGLKLSNSTELKPRERLGDLAWRAVQWCKEPEFRAWLGVHGDFVNELTEDAASEVIKSWCNVESRKELDTNEDAKRLFNQLIRGPYQKHLMARGSK